MPAESTVPPVSARPFCKGCEKRLQPRSRYTYEKIERPLTAREQAEVNEVHGHHAWVPTTAVRHKVIGREFTGYEGYEGFHTLRCALRFALHAHNAGYRIKKR